MLIKYVAVDLEMTGLKPGEDRILEIGGVKFEHGKQIDCFQVLVNPHRQLSDVIRNLTGITQREADYGIEDTEALRQFQIFAQGQVLIGHHIISDFSFLKQTGAKGKIPVSYKAVDTLKLARRFLPQDQKKSLGALAEYYQIREDTCHRALADAKVTAKLYEALCLQFDQADPDAFEPIELEYKVRKQGPASKRQTQNLRTLLEYHHLKVPVEIESLTRSESSRMMDKIIGTYGRIPKDGV